MSERIDLRATEVELYFLAGANAVFNMNLSELFESLSGLTFSLVAYDGPDPDSYSEIAIDYSISTEDLYVYCTIDDEQPEMTNNRKYWFHFTVTDDDDVQSLCYGTIIRKGLR